MPPERRESAAETAAEPVLCFPCRGRGLIDYLDRAGVRYLPCPMCGGAGIAKVGSPGAEPKHV